jgi:hypothetical protein
MPTIEISEQSSGLANEQTNDAMANPLVPGGGGGYPPYCGG